MSDDLEFIKRVYDLFNARDMEAVLATLHEDVVWANGMDGGYVHGREGVRAYWTNQWSVIDPHVDPVRLARGAPGEIVVDVHAVVRDLAGNVLQDHMVGHVFHLDNGLVTRFDIRET
jgi:hypothetical protein